MKEPSNWLLKNTTFGFLDFLIKFGLSKCQIRKIEIEKFVRRHKSRYDTTLPDAYYPDDLI